MKPILVLALVAVSVAAVSATVDIKAWRNSIKHSKTSRQGQTHTLDKFNGPAKGCTPIEMTDADRAYVTKVHNDLRRKVAKGLETRGLPGPQPKAKNMAKMVYDKDLEKVAMAWTAQCVQGHDDYRDIDGYKFVGQNFFMEGSSGPLDKLDWEAVTVAWYDEVKDMNGSAATKKWVGFNPDAEGDVGHYAQVIRAEAKKLGCAAATFREGQWYMRTAICNYGDGVLVGVPLYEAGTPCAGAKKCEDGLVVA